MKKIFCFLGIIVLLGLAFLPPILRFVLPERNEEEEEINHETVILTCSSDRYITNTSYEDARIKMIVLKQLKKDLNTSNEDENILELDQAFTDLKTKSNVIYNILEDGEVIGIDFTLSNHETLNLVKFTKPLTDQKAYYESLGLTCITKK